MSVSVPQRTAQRSFSTSSAVPLVTGEAPMFALILVVIDRPIPIGSRRTAALFATGSASLPPEPAR